MEWNICLGEEIIFGGVLVIDDLWKENEMQNVHLKITVRKTFMAMQLYTKSPNWLNVRPGIKKNVIKWKMTYAWER